MSNLLTLIVGLVGFALIYFMTRRGRSFLTRVLVATALGLVIGFIFQGYTEYLGAIGQIYVNLLKAMVVPLLLFSIISTVISLDDLKTLRSIGAKSIGVLSLHNILGSVMAIIVATLLGVGVNVTMSIPDNVEAAEVPSLTETVINFFPQNIVEDAANNRVVPVVIFALLVGLAALLITDKEKIKPFTNFAQAGNEVMFKLISMITQFTPYAVLALLADRVGGMDLSSVGSILMVLVATFVASFLHSFLTTPAMIGLMARVNPLHFIRKFFPVFMTAFSTQSSVGTLSANITAQKNMGVPERIASFVGPLSTVFGMPGCAAIWPITISIFSINVLGLEVGFGFYLQMIFTAWLVSIGTVGVPGIATVVATTFSLAMGLPAEMVIMMTPISAIADMARTATNVQAGGSSGVIVAALEGDLDKDAYASDGDALVAEAN